MLMFVAGTVSIVELENMAAVKKKKLLLCGGSQSDQNLSF
jgi:hypothetical protein